MAYSLITGASKGIGEAFAECLALEKRDLILVARSEDKLKELAFSLSNKHGIKVQYFALDLSAPNAPKQIIDSCIKQNLDLDILINNAGYGLHGAFADLSLEEQTNMIQLNILSLVQLTYLALPLLQKHKDTSYILNVASTAAYQAVPYLSAYSATKAFVLSFSRGIKLELEKTNISVTCLCPGGVETNFMKRAGMDKSPKIMKQAARFNMMPDEVAEYGIKAMFDGKSEVIPGFANKIGAYSNRFVPKSVVENVAKGIYHV
jgi:short-subunit dehydrogenase